MLECWHTMLFLAPVEQVDRVTLTAQYNAWRPFLTSGSVGFHLGGRQLHMWQVLGWACLVLATLGGPVKAALPEVFHGAYDFWLPALRALQL
mmetsp:Transcript_62847/g.136622  ORF Transcript_62847/g.136622 Transcript_62847/m.136622 type:complete len:92 (+) Transcript_62847:276-551(+)